MKHLHYVELANFKRYGETQRIELDHPAVLIGPNNCGKTSLLQAFALWSIGLRTWNPKYARSWTPSPSFFSPREMGIRGSCARCGAPADDSSGREPWVEA